MKLSVRWVLGPAVAALAVGMMGVGAAPAATDPPSNTGDKSLSVTIPKSTLNGGITPKPRPSKPHSGPRKHHRKAPVATPVRGKPKYTG